MLTLKTATLSASLAVSVLATAAHAQLPQRELLAASTVAAEHGAPAPSPLAKLRETLARGAVPNAHQGTLSNPYGLAVDASGNIYVTQVFGGVNIYSPNLHLTGSITTGVSVPTGVQIAFDGTVYIANNAANDITIYSPGSHTQIGTITDAALVQPESLYVDTDSTAWALDSSGYIHGYMSDGTVLPPTYVPGSAIGPWGPSVTVWGVPDPVSGGWDERATARSNAIRYNPFFGNSYAGVGYTGGEAQDQFGNQYVTDLNKNELVTCSVDGYHSLNIMPLPATGYGVAVDPFRNRVYVALPTLNEVACYSTNYPNKPCGFIK